MLLPLHRNIKPCLFEEVYKNKIVDRAIFTKIHPSKKKQNKAEFLKNTGIKFQVLSEYITAQEIIHFY